MDVDTDAADAASSLSFLAALIVRAVAGAGLGALATVAVEDPRRLTVSGKGASR